MSLNEVSTNDGSDHNDEYGHAVGDEILESIADIIQSSLRDTDSAYRYGGEEILIVLKDSPIDDSVAAMQRLREKISDYVFISYEIELSVTVSIGVTPIKSSDKVSRDTLIRADECLYSAKDNGRNQVVYKI